MMPPADSVCCVPSADCKRRPVRSRLHLIAGVAALALASDAHLSAAEIELRADGVLRPVGVAIEKVTHRGRAAVRVTELPSADGTKLAIVAGSELGDGVIEAVIAGEPADGAPEGSRGFVGIAFRVDVAGYEAFYLRPTNGRADDQLRRNHSTQYVSEPDYPWHRLRQETPGVYESYVDLEPGAWTPIRIVVEGERAELYVDGAQQPTLIVKDLKRGPDARGAIALWIGQGTVAHFRDLRVTPR